MPTPPMGAAASAGMSTGLKVGLSLLGGLLVGGVAGYGAGRVSTGASINPVGSQKGSYAEGYAAARAKLQEAGIIPSAQVEVKTISGVVTEVGAASLVMETSLRAPDPLAETQPPKMRTVNVDGATKIMRLTQKDPGEFQKELEAFQKANDPSKPFPQPYDTEVIALADIKIDDYVNVTAGTDILNASEFTALEVTVSAGAGAGPGPAVMPPGQSPPPPPPPPQQ